MRPHLNAGSTEFTDGVTPKQSVHSVGCETCVVDGVLPENLNDMYTAVDVQSSAIYKAP